MTEMQMRDEGAHEFYVHNMDQISKSPNLWAVIAFKVGWSECHVMQSKKIAALESELERERMRLVACGVVALSNTRESFGEIMVDKGHQYYSASLHDVARSVKSEILYRECLKIAMDALEAIGKPSLQDRMASRSEPENVILMRVATEALEQITAKMGSAM